MQFLPGAIYCANGRLVGGSPGTFGRICHLPGRMHPVSRMVLDYFLNNDLPNGKFRRLFSLPDSDLVTLGGCLVAKYEN